eukprot:5364052-Pyramimonas_sp.AAC.1
MKKPEELPSRHLRLPSVNVTFAKSACDNASTLSKHTARSGRSRQARMVEGDVGRYGLVRSPRGVPSQRWLLDRSSKSPAYQWTKQTNQCFFRVNHLGSTARPESHTEVLWNPYATDFP